MSQKYENLSALMDGEHQHEDGLDAVINDADAMEAWQRYHLIRDGLRKELPEQLNFDISASVAKALEDEPAILAPKPRKLQDLPVIGNVIPLARQAGQFAIAASVAAVMIFGVQQMNQPDPEQPFSVAPTGVIQGGLAPVSLEQTRALPRNDMAEQRRRINAYLTDHQQQMRLKADAEKTDKKQEETPEQAPQ